MKLSIVINVLNSHKMVRRQLLHFERIGLPEGVELLIVDDGSDPPIEVPSWARVHRTNDRRPWTCGVARNSGAAVAKGKRLLMFDIDGIVTRELLDYVVSSSATKVQFKREFGALTEDGELTQDRDVLAGYGIPRERKNLKLAPITNNFAILRDVFFELGGYAPYISGDYPQKEDRDFKKRWGRYEAAGKGTTDTHRPTLYVVPTGRHCEGGDVDTNPHELFHNLSRRRNHAHAQ